MSLRPDDERDDDEEFREASVRRSLEENCLICHTNDMIASQRLTPAQWKAEIEKMSALASPLRSFVDEHCILGADQIVVEQDFYREWKDWCYRVGHHHGTLIKLSADLTVQYPNVRSGVRPRVNGIPGPRCFAGVGLIQK